MTATAVGTRVGGRRPWPARQDGDVPPLWRDAVVVAITWVSARLVVLGADRVVIYLHGRVAQLPSVGLFGWDAGYYRAIAAHGYAPLPPAAERFWPLTALLARAVHTTGLSIGGSLLLVDNVGAFMAGLLLVRLARREGWAPAVTDRLPWLLALAPPAYVLVMGYSEGVAIALSIAAFGCYRSGRWGTGIVVGVLGGLCRPIGVLLAIPATVEAVRSWRGASSRERATSLTAAGAPLVGSGLYLAYIGHRFGSALRPYRVQAGPGLHGHPGDPITTISHALRGAAHHNIGTAVDVPWLLLFAVLLVVMVWRLPASYTLWSLANFLAVISGNNLDSDQRYLWATFPFLVVAAGLLGDRPRLWWATITISTSLLTAYTVLALTHSVVP